MKLLLGNLTQLKAFLLNEGIREQTTWDSALEALGKGVAYAMENHCARKWERTVGDTFEASANRSMLLLPRYPVEEITAVAIRTDLASGWVDQGTVSDTVIQLGTLSGLVEFGYPLGGGNERVRLTYTGGYWVPDDETVPPETSTSKPAGATAVPDALHFAWLLQCKHVWGMSDPLGLATGEDKAGVSPDMMGLSRIELIPQVKATLEGFKRYAL